MASQKPTTCVLSGGTERSNHNAMIQGPPSARFVQAPILKSLQALINIIPDDESPTCVSPQIGRGGNILIALGVRYAKKVRRVPSSSLSC